MGGFEVFLQKQSTSTPFYEWYTTKSKYNISIDGFESCLDGEALPELIEDASEIENFGMVGINPRIYIGFNGNDNTVLDGIPSNERLRISLLYYQVQIGD